MISSRTWPWRRTMPILAMAATAAAGLGVPVAAGATTPAAITCSTKAIQPSVAGDQNTLLGVAVKNGCNALAVGSNGRRSLALHWNGQSWRRVAVPLPAGSNGAELDRVAFDSPTTAWAVGLSTVTDSPGHLLTLIMRWNGRSWHQVKSPSPGGIFGDSGLSDVVATSPTNAMAIGYQTDSGQLSFPLAEVWNGHKWARVNVPWSNSGDVEGGLNGVAAAPHGTAWTVGSYGTVQKFIGSVIDFYSDGQFTQTKVTQPAGICLNAVASASATRAWTVGGVCAGTSKPIILEWNGATWSRQAISGLPAATTADSLSDITVASPSNAWAVGYFTTKSGVGKDLIVHWNGTQWRVVPSANPGGTGKPSVSDQLNGVSGGSCATLWAVGVVDNAKQNYANHSIAVRC